MNVMNVKNFQYFLCIKLPTSTTLLQSLALYIKMVFRVKNRQNFTNSTEDQRPEHSWYSSEVACKSDISEEKYQNILTIVALIYRSKMER